MLDFIGGRKMAISAVAAIICVAVTLTKGDIPPGLKDMLQYILGVFIAGNVGSDLVAAVGSRRPSVSSETQVAADPQNQLEVPPTTQQDAVNQQLLQGIQAVQQGVSYIISRIAPPQQ